MKKLYFVLALLPLLGCNQNISKQEDLNPSTLVKNQEINENHNSQLLNNVTGINLSGEHDQEQKENEAYSNIKPEKMIDVPLIKQNPELKYGCEVTSLAMVLNYGGVKVTKMDLYKQIRKDHDPIVKSKGDILKWGNPAEGFVGDMTGKNPGYAVFDKPIAQLVNHYMPGKAVNLTDRPFEEILNHVSKGFPVVIWTTGDYRLPDRWESWQHGNEVIKTPLDLHAVVLVGYNSKNVYINDPLSGKKQVKISKERFIASWKALKCRAVSYQ